MAVLELRRERAEPNIEISPNQIGVARPLARPPRGWDAATAGGRATAPLDLLKSSRFSSESFLQSDNGFAALSDEIAGLVLDLLPATAERVHQDWLDDQLAAAKA